MPGMNSPFGPPQSQDQMIQALMQHLAQQGGGQQANMASQMGQNPLMQQMNQPFGQQQAGPMGDQMMQQQNMLNTPPPM